MSEAPQNPGAQHHCDVAILGAGPVGLYAAYYTGFRAWSSIVMDTLPEPGGQITAMYPEKLIFDVAGIPSVRGRDLVEALVAQAAPFKPTYILGEQAIELHTSEEGPVTIVGSLGTRIVAKAAVITGGIGSFTPRRLPSDVHPDGGSWEGRGLVYFVPSLEAHRDEDVVIVGGGDSAFDWAASLLPVARSIHLVHRREEFRAHAGTVEALRASDLVLHTSSEVTAISGTDRVSSVTVTSKATGEEQVLPATTVIAALGFIANIGPISGWGLDLDKRHISVDSAMETSLPRVYAAGDITAYPGKVPLISVGFGEAALAVNNASRWVDPAHGLFPGHSSGGEA